MTAQSSRGKALSDKLHQHLSALQAGSCGARERPVIWGVTPGGQFVGNMTLAAFLAQSRRILRESGSVYRYGNSVVFEARPLPDHHLRVLATSGAALPNANAALSNLFAVGVKGDETCSQSVVPP